MLRDLGRRLDRLTELMDRPPRYGDSRSRPMLIRVLGGIDSEPLHASIDGMVVEIEPGETAGEFEKRAVRIGIEVGATLVVIGGLPDRCIGRVYSPILSSRVRPDLLGRS